MKAFLRYIKRNIVIILAVISFGLSLFFAYTIFYNMGYFNPADQTLVGTIYISNYDDNQYPGVITSEINDWKARANYTVKYHDFEYEVDLSYFSVDLDATIQSIIEGSVNPVFFTLSDQNRVLLEQDFEDVFSANISDHIDFDTFLSDLDDDMQEMNIIKHYALETYFESDLQATIIDTVLIDNINTADVNQITQLMDQIIISATDRFSLLEQLDGLELTNNQLSIIASGIQKATCNTPFEGYIFAQNYTLPVWAEQGMNVKILKTNHYDFTFYNPINLEYSISIEKTDDNSITFSLIGYPFVAEYNVAKVNESNIPYETIYNENLDLDGSTPGIITEVDGTETTYRLLIQSGIEGEVLSYVRTITLPDSTVYTQIIYLEIYYPVNEIYEENVVEAGD